MKQETKSEGLFTKQERNGFYVTMGIVGIFMLMVTISEGVFS